MRDIKRTGKPKGDDEPQPEELPEEAKKLYEKHKPEQKEKKKSKKPRFTGKSVPVSHVHAPKSSPPARKATQKEQVTGDATGSGDGAADNGAETRRRFKRQKTMSGVRQEASTEENPQQEKRPLFAKFQQSKEFQEASKKSWGKKRKKEKKGSVRLGHKERMVVLSLFVVLALIGGLAALLFLPKASIALSVDTAPLLVDQELTIARSERNDDAGILPGSAYTRNVEVSGTSPVISTKTVGKKATGTVYIVNRTFEEQKIKEESRLVTDDGTLFYMQSHAIVPAAPSSGELAQVPVEVEAAEAGEQGNIEDQRLNFAALDESSQSVVYAEVREPLTGGSGDEVTVVQESDLQQAREAAKNAARHKVEESVRNELSEGWVLLDESWETELNEFNTDAEIGQQIGKIEYTSQATVRVMAYKKSSLTDHLRMKLEAQLEEDYMLFPGPISFTKSVDAINWERGEGKIVARVTHTTIPTFSLETLQEKLAGRSKDEAISYLEGLDGVSSAEIDLWPFWVQSIPRIEKRIDIDIESNRNP